MSRNKEKQRRRVKKNTSLKENTNQQHDKHFRETENGKNEGKTL